MKVFVVLALAFACVSANALRDGVLRAIHPKDKPKSSIEGRITNGYPASEGKVPYIVGLSLNSNGNYWWCGGSIIGNTWVVTAAHCTSGADAVIIYYGATWQTQPQFTHHLTSGDVIRHPDYVGNDHDISLIRTPHVDFWSLVNKVELPSMNDRYNSFAEWWALASGWGAVYDGSNTVEYLNCLDAQIIDNSECQAYYGYETVTDNVICIRAPDGKSTCQGDSGGPLVTHDGNRLVGITSFVSIFGCQSGAPAGFTRVTSYLDWIRDTTGISY